MILKIFVKDIHQFVIKIGILILLAITCFICIPLGTIGFDPNVKIQIVGSASAIALFIVALSLSLEIMSSDSLLDINAFWKARPIGIIDVIISKFLFLLLIISPILTFGYWSSPSWKFSWSLIFIVPMIFSAFFNDHTAVVALIVFLVLGFYLIELFARWYS